MRKLQHLVSNKWFYLFLVPLILFLFCAVFSLQYIISRDTHFTVMPVVQTDNARLQIPQSHLVDGQVVKGEFVATRDNLGAIALGVKNIHDESVPDNYKLFFRMKEKGAKEWYSSNSYSAGQFRELDLFPFGFNLIQNSKGRTYIFEMFSKGANEKNALTFDKNKKIVGQYQLNKSDLKNPIFAGSYIIGKVIYLFHNIGAVSSSLIFFLPVYAYFFLIAEKNTVIIPTFILSILLFKFIRRKIVSPTTKMLNIFMRSLNKRGIIDDYQPVKTVSLLNIVLFITMLIEIFLIEDTNNMLLLLILVLWGITIIVHKIKLQTTFLFALGFLSMCFILFVFGLDRFAEKASIWAYLFLVIGAFQSILIFGLEKKVSKK